MPLPETGPYIMTAVLCERCLQDQDGLTSIIRIVDRITFPAPDDPETNPALIDLTLVVAFKSGSARGSHKVTIRVEMPSGIKRGPEQFGTVLFEGEDRGVSLIVPVKLLAKAPGVYWFDVLLDDVLFTRVPLRVIFQQEGQMQ